MVFKWMALIALWSHIVLPCPEIPKQDGFLGSESISVWILGYERPDRGADDPVNFLQRDRRLERTEKLNSLTGCKEFDGNHSLHVPDYLLGF